MFSIHFNQKKNKTFTVVMKIPSGVIVIVNQARHLVIKARSGINKAYATIELLQEKYVTEVEKSLMPKWMSECSFPVNEENINNQCKVIVNVFHKHTGLYGLEPDVFLGRVEVPLLSLHFEDDISCTEWYKLSGKKLDSKKDRGEIQLTFQFVFLPKASLSKEKQVSLERSMSKVVKEKLKSQKYFLRRKSMATKTIDSRVKPRPNSAINDSSEEYDYLKDEYKDLAVPNRVFSDVVLSSPSKNQNSENMCELSENELSFPTARSHSLNDITFKSKTISSLNYESNTLNKTAGRASKRGLYEKLRFSIRSINRDKQSKTDQKQTSLLTDDDSVLLERVNKAQLLHVVLHQRELLKKKDVRIKELEDYIDRLLVKVMSTNQVILDGSKH